MSKVLVTESHLNDIAEAIRAKNGSADTYRPGDMADAILAIAPQPVLQQKSVTVNGTVTPDSGYDGLSQVDVDVPNTYAASDEGKVVSNGALVQQTARENDITLNGTYDTTENNSVTVNVAGGLSYFNIFQVGSFGGAQPAAAASLTVNINGYSGFYAVIVVIHRSALATPAGCTLIDNVTFNDNGNIQYSSVFKCAIDSASKSIAFTQASSGRLGATVWAFDRDVSLTRVSATKYTNYYNTSFSITAQGLALITFSAWSAQTVSGERAAATSNGAWLCQSLPNELALRHFSGIVMPTAGQKTFWIRERSTASSPGSVNAQVCVYSIAEATA